MKVQLTCKLTSPELRKRRTTVIGELKQLIRKKEEIKNGLAFIFSSEDVVLDKLVDFIKSERLCCDFFSFSLQVANDIARLEITGPYGSKDFLEQEVGF